MEVGGDHQFLCIYSKGVKSFPSAKQKGLSFIFSQKQFQEKKNAGYRVSFFLMRWFEFPRASPNKIFLAREHNPLVCTLFYPPCHMPKHHKFVHVCPHSKTRCMTTITTMVPPPAWSSITSHIPRNSYLKLTNKYTYIYYHHAFPWKIIHKEKDLHCYYPRKNILVSWA